MADCVAGAINLAQSKFDNPPIVVGGDMNNRPFAQIADPFPDINQIDVGNTR